MILVSCFEAFRFLFLKANFREIGAKISPSIFLRHRLALALFVFILGQFCHAQYACINSPNGTVLASDPISGRALVITPSAKITAHVCNGNGGGSNIYYSGTLSGDLGNISSSQLSVLCSAQDTEPNLYAYT